MFPDKARPVYGVFVHRQVKALQQLGCQCHVLSPVSIAPFPFNRIRKKWRNWANVPKTAVLEDVKIDYPRVFYFPGGILPHRIGAFWYYLLKRKVARLRTQFPFDIIHCHTAFPDGQAGVMLARDFGTPVITVIHGGDFLNPRNLRSSRRQALAKVLKASDKVVTVSSQLAKIGVSVIGEPSHFVTIANGVDPNELFTGASIERQAYPDKTILLSVGNLKETKGFDYSIKALARLLPYYPQLLLLIGGDGPEAARLKILAEKEGVARQVKFLGRLSHTKVMEYMSFADVFLLPSWREGFGIVYVEAMAHGKPIVACQGQGISDIIDNWQNGVLVKPKDLDSLTTDLERLLAEPALRQAIGARARAFVFADLSWQDNARRLLALSQDIIESAGHRP